MPKNIRVPKIQNYVIVDQNKKKRNAHEMQKIQFWNSKFNVFLM